MLRDHVASRVHVSVEEDERLGTAGALGRLRPWIAGRHVLVHNADSLVDDDLAALLDGWDGVRPRLLVRTEDHDSDFGRHRFLGVSLVPAAIAATPAGRAVRALRPRVAAGVRRGQLELVEATGTSIDCGTPADYLRANLHVSGGASVVDPSAVVEGSVTRCVVWPGAA